MKKLLPILMLSLVLWGCPKKGSPPNILLLPKVLSLDLANSRLFVVDAEDNNLSLIDTSNNTIVTGNPLLNGGSAIRLPTLPQDVAAINLGNGVSRIFIIGNGPAPTNVIMVLDYDSTNGLTVAPISPITTADSSTDLLAGLAIDPDSSTLFVSNATANLVRAYDVNAGTEKAGSPLAVQPNPSKMRVNTAIDRLFVSSLGSNSITILNTQDLTLAPAALDVGIPTGSVASSTNATGTVLFVLSPLENEIEVYNFNVSDPGLSTLIGSPITPPAPTTTPAPTDVLSGAATQVASGVRFDESIAGCVTQSTGDLGFIDVSADLTTLSTGLVSVINGQGATGIDILLDGNGDATFAYFAAPGGSAVSFVDIVNNLFAGQFL